MDNVELERETIGKKEIKKVTEKIIRGEYGYGGSRCAGDPTLENDIWIVPVEIHYKKGIFTEFDYRTLDHLDLGTFSKFEFCASTGKVLFKPPLDEIIKTEYERLAKVESKSHEIINIISWVRNSGAIIKVDHNIYNILTKIYGRPLVYGLVADRDLDWITNGDYDEVLHTLGYLVNSGIISLDRNYDGECVYYADNILVELAYNSTNINDLILNVSVALELGEDLNCKFWN